MLKNMFNYLIFNNIIFLRNAIIEFKENKSSKNKKIRKKIVFLQPQKNKHN